MSVYIIRHGESLANLHPDLPLLPEYKDIHDEDVALSGWGYRQAVKAGEFLAADRDAGRRLVVIRSPFLRTEQTTEGLLRGMGATGEAVQESPLMREQSFGLFNCITDRRIIARLWPKEHAAFVKARQEDKHTAKAPGGESRADVVARAEQLVERYRADFEDPDTDVVLVGHGLVNRAVEMCLRGLHKEWLRKEPNPTNCSIRKLEGDLQHGYAAGYVHRGETRSPHFPKDYLTAPHGHKASALAL